MAKRMNSDKDYIITKKQSRQRWIFWIILGLIVFIFIYFPFFVLNLRFQAGQLISETLSSFGMILVPAGGILMIWGFITTLCSKSLRGIKTILVGFIFFYVGFWCNGGSLGLPFIWDEITGGYH